MRIALIDVDSHHFPNLPLMKLSAYHKAHGDTVGWWNPLDTYDIAYKSKVFTFTPDIDECIQADVVIEGGTGYGLSNKLPDCVEHIMPDYSLYPQYTEAYGFLTRGCPRNCEFCIVSKKEGRCSHHVADLSEFRSNQRKIKLFDPNLLACRDREKLIQQLLDSRAYVDFTQGLDIRFCDRDIIQLLNKVKVKMLHFAWDNPDEDLTEQFTRFADNSAVKDCRKRRVYVLTNFTSTHEQDLYRIHKLREMGFDPYVMIYDKDNALEQTRHLQRWVNNKWIFRSCERFEDYRKVRV